MSYGDMMTDREVIEGAAKYDFRCQACDGTGLADNATAEVQQARMNAAAEILGQADRRWRQAAEAVLQAVTVEGQPALDYIDRVVRMVEGIAAK